ncbi:hypothetical protein ACQ0MK_20600 [Thalassospira lucentensis]|uniref:hypothetical protein n=1 Tax=Thalassospira lucentensis TaxID=168935 RepID=UPI003D2F23B0
MAYSGMHKDFQLNHFSQEEQNIIKRFSKEWYLTSATSPIRMNSGSTYNAFLGKACEPFEEMFNLERELIFMFSDYPEFEVRTLDGFAVVAERFPTLRTDPICRVLISRDVKISERIQDVLKNDPELPIIVPFNYDEFSNKSDKHFIENRFRENFFSRDLFAFESPLKRDTYFFGRSSLINDLISRHRSNENSALFGLRRSGKTSILFGLERSSRLNSKSFISIDCQSPSVHKRRWNELLYYIVNEIVKKYSIKKNTIELSSYSEKNAADQFHDDIKTIYSILNKSPILIAFDEIERISPRTASSSHWREEDDFVFFWQAIRSSFQKHTGVFSFLLIGTNPQAVETATINGNDNPIYNSVPIEYIPGFDLPQTTEMVRKLGRYMGLEFEDAVYSSIHNDFGGHPYLIRHVCSLMHKKTSNQRPARIDRSVYNEARREFDEDYANYTDMILEVLTKDYPDEYVMISALANENRELFDSFKEDNSLTSHLRGYGLIERGAKDYFFKIESVKNHLQKKERFDRPVKNNDDRIREIATRRALLEPSLRKIILTIYTIHHGPNATKKIEPNLKGQAKTRLIEEGFQKTFSQNSISTNFSDLSRIIESEWEMFKNIFPTIKRDEFAFHMEAIRKARTLEAHSGEISPDDFNQARISFKKIEDNLRKAGFLN